MWKGSSKRIMGIKKAIKRIIRKSRKIVVKSTSKSTPGFKEKLYKKFSVGKRKTVSIADIFYKNMKDGELFRYDIVVRYLAIECFHGLNDYGYDLYNKMQNARQGDGYAETSMRKFVELIKSFEADGYDQSSSILIGQDFGIIDGSHRMALALYYGAKEIPVWIIPATRMVDYSIDWFMMHGFSAGEIEALRDKANEIKEKMNATFSCVIWSPAVFLAEDIIHDLGFFGEVLTVKRYVFDETEYERIVRAIYSIDDIDEWKIDKKIEHMPHGTELVALDVKLDDPAFRIKDSTGMLLSTKGERIKRALRARYKDRIQNYFFDIILHMGDNFQQSEFMRNVFYNGQAR